MVDVEVGIVVDYDKRRNMRSGFLQKIDEEGRPIGPRIFLRSKNGCVVALNGGKPRLVPPTRNGRPISVFEPRIGDRLVFIRALGFKQHRVKVWGYARSWQQALRSTAAVH